MNIIHHQGFAITIQFCLKKKKKAVWSIITDLFRKKQSVHSETLYPWKKKTQHSPVAISFNEDTFSCSDLK